jgi:siroheme synthase (precorrin-2 oxidase/ferrochelatase)
MLRKIQSRSHSKVIEVLLYSEKMIVVSNELEDHLYKLQAAFKIVEVSLKTLALLCLTRACLVNCRNTGGQWVGQWKQRVKSC